MNWKRSTNVTLQAHSSSYLNDEIRLHTHTAWICSNIILLIPKNNLFPCSYIRKRKLFFVEFNEWHIKYKTKSKIDTIQNKASIKVVRLLFSTPVLFVLLHWFIHWSNLHKKLQNTRIYFRYKKDVFCSHCYSHFLSFSCFTRSLYHHWHGCRWRSLSLLTHKNIL